MTTLVKDGSFNSRVELVENAVEQSTGDAKLSDAKSDWGSLWIAFVILFIFGIQFSVYFSSMYPYLQQIAPESLDLFGWILACYSIGQMISSPLLGFWTNHFKTTKLPIMLSVLVNLLGNVIYVLTGSLESNRQWVLMVARFITGLGAESSFILEGALSILRAYVAEASSPSDRARALSIATTAQSVGIAIGPGLQAIFGSVGYPGTQVGIASFNMYTCPGYFVIALMILLEIALFFFFHENYVGVYNAKTEDPYTVLPKLHWIPALVMIWCWFAMLFSYVVGETVGTPLTMSMFDWTTSEASTNNGWIFSGGAVVSFFVYMAITFCAKDRVDARVAIIFGFVLMVCYYLVSFSWPGLPDITISTTNATTTTNYSDITFTIPNDNSSSSLHTTTPIITTTELSGCNSEYEWCTYTTRINFAMYIVAMICTSVGFPICTLFTSVLYAGIIGPRRSGKMQGALVFAGSVARCFGPIFISYMFLLYGPRVTWAIVGAKLILTILIVSIAFKHLVPLKLHYKAGENFRYKRGVMWKF